jgi:L-aspartate-L-methionine ligase
MSTIRPRFKLIDLCGPGYVFNSRAPENAAQWIFESPAVADAATGSQLTVIGSMPVLCSAGVATDAGLGLLREIGFAIEPELVTYTDTGDRLVKMKRLAARNLTFIDQHVQTDASLHPGVSWVNPAQLSALNNKRNLSMWVPAAHLPAREICELSSLFCRAKRLERFPVVIKSVTEKSSGGGFGIRICHNESEVDAACHFFRSLDSVIVEDYLAMHQNLCVNYAVFADGRIEYLGAAQQIINDKLRYLGNWLEPPGAQMSRLIHVGYEVMQKAYEYGYRGFAGFDAAIREDGSFHIYDLNFRFNGSTASLLLYDALAQRTGMPVAKNASWKFKSGFDNMIRSLRQAVEKHQLIPISTFDPTCCNENYNPEPRLRALLFGINEEDIKEKQRELDSLGFYCL